MSNISNLRSFANTDSKHIDSMQNTDSNYIMGIIRKNISSLSLLTTK